MVRILWRTDPEDGMKAAYTLREAAEVVSYSESTLRRAILAGDLKAIGGGRGERYRISGVELERWWRAKGGGDLFPETSEKGQ